SRTSSWPSTSRPLSSTGSSVSCSRPARTRSNGGSTAMSPIDPADDDALAPPAPADDWPLLHVSGLTKTFGTTRVLDGVDLEVRRGEVVVLIGPSGSGKTTVLRSLNGLETPEAGVVSFATGPRVDFSTPVSKTDRIALRDQSAM